MKIVIVWFEYDMLEIPFYNYPRIAGSKFGLILVIAKEYRDHMEVDIEYFIAVLRLQTNAASSAILWGIKQQACNPICL